MMPNRFVHRLAMASLASAAILAAPASAAGKAEMTIATFLAKADALKAKGPLALMSPDIGLLKGEVNTAAARYKARLEADKKAGRPPHSCPAKGAKVSSDEFLTHLRSYPAARRPSVTVGVAFDSFMVKRFPCPAR